MRRRRAVRPDPHAGLVSETHLHAWWERQVGDAHALGIDPEKVAESMFAVAAKHLAAALGPRQLGRVSYLLAMKLAADADQIDAATAAATAVGACRH